MFFEQDTPKWKRFFYNPADPVTLVAFWLIIILILLWLIKSVWLGGA
jgi:hypothetical protein